jgi:hypothetical protein
MGENEARFLLTADIMCQRTTFSSHGDMCPRYVHPWPKYSTQLPMRSAQNTGLKDLFG